MTPTICTDACSPYNRDFRGTTVRVCDRCGTVTVLKGDFKQLLKAAPQEMPNEPKPQPLLRNIPSDPSTARTQTEPDPRPARGGMLHSEPTLGLDGSDPHDDSTEEAVYPGITTNPDLEFEAELEAMQQRKARRQMMLLGGAGAVVLALLVGTIGWAVWTNVGGTTAEPPPPTIASALKPQEPEAPPEAAKPEEGTAEAPAADTEKPATDDAPEPEAPEAEPEVEPSGLEADGTLVVEPAEPPPPPKPKGPSAASLIGRGWNAVDSNPADALLDFEQALAIAEGHPEALYGKGYALMKLQRTDEAATQLCRAQRDAGADLSREISSLIERNGMTCP